MEKKIYIGSTLVNTYIKSVTFTDNSENQIDTATIYTKPLSNTDFISPLADVKIIIAGETIFKGFILKITKNPSYNPQLYEYTLECVSDIEKLKHIYISEAFENEIAGDIVRYLIQKYTDYTTNHIYIW